MKTKGSFRVKWVCVGVVAVILLGGGLGKADFIFGDPMSLEAPVNSPDLRQELEKFLQNKTEE